MIDNNNKSFKCAGIYYCDTANGEGVRTALFVSGCYFKCPHCFNEKYQDFNYGTEYNQEIENSIINNLKLPYINGLSILGGEPLHQSVYGLTRIFELIKRVKKETGKNIWMWSGFTWEHIFPKVVTDDFNLDRVLRQQIVSNIDVLIDGQFENDKKDLSLAFRGSFNQRIIDVPQSLSKGEIILWKQSL